MLVGDYKNRILDKKLTFAQSEFLVKENAYRNSRNFVLERKVHFHYSLAVHPG